VKATPMGMRALFCGVVFATNISLLLPEYNCSNTSSSVLSNAAQRGGRPTPRPSPKAPTRARSWKPEPLSRFRAHSPYTLFEPPSFYLRSRSLFADVWPPSKIDSPRGIIQADLPWVVRPGEWFEIDLWLLPSDIDASSVQTQSSSPHFIFGPIINAARGVPPIEKLGAKTVDVIATRVGGVEYSEENRELAPGEKIKMNARVIDSPSGLARVVVRADDWEPLSVVVTTGLAVRVDSSLPKTLEAGMEYDFELSFKGIHGDLVPLGAPATLMLSGEHLSFMYKGMPHPVLEVYVPGGSQTSRTLTATPTRRLGGSAALAIDVRINNDYSVGEFRHEFVVQPEWWTILLLCISGGAMYSAARLLLLVETLKRYKRERRLRVAITTSALALIASGIAYMLGRFDVLGLHLEATGPRTFVLLGFLFSYVGVDALANRLLGRESSDR